jgi:Holliday junction DNA helicase RuvB
MEDTFDIRNNRELQETEREFENALRPLSFSSFSGQDKVVENLKIFVSAARMRGESLDHVLLHGPPPDWGKPHFPILLPMSWG